MLKPCVKCIHNRYHEGNPCCIRDTSMSRDVVTGKKIYLKVTYCRTERREPRRCSEHGKFFIHKNPVMRLIYKLMNW